ncbi:MAG: hypothetical protein ACE5F1_02340 [Planctomycetota bacterium]
MRRRILWLGPLVLATAIPLVLRIRYFAAFPGFEPGIVYYRRPQLELEGVQMLRRATRGELTIRAGALRPGHERLGFFELGPSTFFELERIRARCTAEQGAGWELSAATAKLQQRRIVIQNGPVLVVRGGRLSTIESATIHLDSGRLVTR